jgi:hypothetical protein
MVLPLVDLRRRFGKARHKQPFVVSAGLPPDLAHFSAVTARTKGQGTFPARPFILPSPVNSALSREKRPAVRQRAQPSRKSPCRVFADSYNAPFANAKQNRKGKQRRKSMGSRRRGSGRRKVGRKKRRMRSKIRHRK